MRNKIIKFLLVLAITPSTSQCQEKNRLVGEWADIKNNRLKMNFHADNTVVIIMNGKSSLSQNLTITYKVEYSKNPNWIDLTIKKPSGESMNVNGIIDFVNDSTINLVLNKPGEVRPVELKKTKENNVGTLTRSRHMTSESSEKSNRHIVSGKRNGKEVTDTVEIKDEYVLNELRKIQEQGANYKPTQETTTEEFDDKGNLTKKYATSLEKSLYKLSYTKYTYDKSNRQVKAENFDTSNKLVNVDYDISVTEFAYDKNGNLIEEKYYDKELKPAVFELGPHVIRCVYDEKNRIIETIFLDKESRPLKDHARIKHIYDKSGELTELIYFDDKGIEIKREKK